MRPPTTVLPALVPALVAVLVAVLGLGPAAGRAPTATDAGADPAGDQLTHRADGQGPTWRVAKRHRAGDIVGNSASFGTDVVVVTTYRAFAQHGYTLFRWDLKTVDQKGSPYWSATLEVKAGQDHGVFSLTDPIANPVSCGGAVMDPAARTVTLTVPATCLGGPAWVKVGNGSTVVNVQRDFWDDARLEGTINGSWRFGPRLTRG